jgi:RNA polymerase sigma-70 factor (ECF subfamily)
VALREEELTSLSDDVDLDRDRVLVERCQAGDSAAFGNLYARYYERLLRFCLRRLNDRHEAEDAAQEAFARAWKALPRFAGERRFYPWLTVIAGNICTDMLRRRSRSTPTDDLELTAQHPLGVVVEDTSEELVLAAVDGELVHRALDRLSTRHRHVLAMREGSGWTYQQIADHEGVEIGTIETLLWRARQALKREFAVISDSKEALAGFLIATGAVLRRTVFRAAHRGATVHHNSSSGGGSGALRNAVAGVAVTGAAVAAAFIAPHAISNGPSGAASAPGSALAAPPLVVGSVHQGGTDNGGSAAPQALGGSLVGSGDGTVSDVAGGSSGGLGSQGGDKGSAGATGGATSLLGGGQGGRSGSGAAGVTGGLNQAGNGLSNTVNGATGGVSQIVSGATGGVGQIVGGVTNGVGQTVDSVTSGVGAVTNGLTQSIGLGSVLPGSSGAGSSSSAATTTTTTTNPVQGIVGGTAKTVGGLIGG